MALKYETKLFEIQEDHKKIEIIVRGKITSLHSHLQIKHPKVN